MLRLYLLRRDFSPPLLALLCFVNEHDGNVVNNRIDAATSGAPQAVLLLRQLDRFFARRANENIQQLLR